MSGHRRAILLLLVAAPWAGQVRGQSGALVPNTSSAAATPQEGPVAHYFRDYLGVFREDIKAIKETCDNAKKGDHDPQVPTYDRFNQWIACAQDIADGDAYAIDFGMAPAGNGVFLGLKLKYHEALTENLDSNVEIVGNISYRGTWTTYGYWSLKPYWISKIDSDKNPVFRIFGGSQKIQILPYYGEGEQTNVNSVAYYALQRTPFAVRLDVPIILHPDKHQHTRTITMTPSVQMGGHWFVLTDASSPGISTVNAGGRTYLLATPKYFEQAASLTVVSSTYGIRHLEQADSVAMTLSNHDDVGTGDHSFRQFTGRWNHDLQFNCYAWQLPAARGVSTTHTLQDCFELDLVGGITETVADAGDTIPFFLQPSVGGSDINGLLTIPSYADYRFRGPDTEYGTAILRYPLYRLLHKLKLPVELTARADTGKAALRRDELGIHQMRHSYSAGFSVKAGNMAAIDFLYAWGGRESSNVHALLNPAILGEPLTGFW